jgi:hypothetical protein
MDLERRYFAFLRGGPEKMRAFVAALAVTLSDQTHPLADDDWPDLDELIMIADSCESLHLPGEAARVRRWACLETSDDQCH